ncbi:putative polysaccharide biosynthesis protein [Solibacillus sp. FSL W7-1324]|uniref:putative polysaccharide biosynthesis protein n=1 Tax=Solibacillus sp. FSL W7-1324 TaxID=2921701 RepID=UPI0030F8F3DD
MFVIFISKCLGFLYRMQFMRIAGEEAVGLYMTAYPTFIFFISLIQLGIPIAISKLIAEYHAKRKTEHVTSVMKTAIKISAISIILFSPFIYFAIPYIAKVLLHNENLIFTLYISLFTIPIVIFSSLIKAYLQGLAKIAPTAWAQLLEQLVRIGLIVVLLPYFISESPAMTAAAAMGITAIGEVFSLLFLAIFYKRSSRMFKKGSTGTSFTKPIFNIALPSAGSKLFGTFTWFLEPIIFLKALTVSGLAAGAATTLYGIISGVHIPLLLFPAFIPAALAIVLIPAVSSALASNNYTLLNKRITHSLRLSSLIGCMAATVFFIHGDELTMVLFHLEENRGYMKILAPIFYFYYIQSPLHSILQALDEAQAAMMNSIYGGIGKLFLLFFLASQPAIQEKGAIIAIGFGVLITSFLHIASIKQQKKINVGFRFFVLPYGIFILTSFVQPIIAAGMPLMISVAITIGFVLLLLFITKQIRFNDFQYLRSIFSRS